MVNTDVGFCQNMANTDVGFCHSMANTEIEIKAGENVSGGSAAAFVKRYDTVDSAVRFSQLDYKDQGLLVNIPLCAADFFISQL